MSKVKVTKALLDKHLSKEVKEHFEVDNTAIISLKFIHPKYGNIDFKTMSKKRAESLVKEGCPFLKPKSSGKGSNK